MVVFLGDVFRITVGAVIHDGRRLFLSLYSYVDIILGKSWTGNTVSLRYLWVSKNTIRMDRLLKKTEIKKHITPHSFRHTHTSLLIEANVHIKEIQECLGHLDINTTMDIYAHMTQNIKKEASKKFRNLMKDLSDNLIS